MYLRQPNRCLSLYEGAKEYFFGVFLFINDKISSIVPLNFCHD